jgi:uncharacterized membrane protein
MENKARFFGRPISPFLVVLPLVSFVLTMLFDLVYLATGKNEAFAIVSYIFIICGVLCGLLTAVVGIIEFHAIPKQTISKTIGAWHLFGNLVVVALFALSWLIRASGNPGQPPILAIGLSIAGLIMGTVTAWLSGELIDRALPQEDEPGSLLGGQSPVTRIPGFQVPVTGSKYPRQREKSPLRDRPPTRQKR